MHMDTWIKTIIEPLRWCYCLTRGGSGDVPCPSRWQSWFVAYRGLCGLVLVFVCHLGGWLFSSQRMLGSLVGAVSYLCLTWLVQINGRGGEYDLARCLCVSGRDSERGAARCQAMYMYFLAIRFMVVFVLCHAGASHWFVPVFMFSGCVVADRMKPVALAKGPAGGETLVHWIIALVFSLLFCGFMGDWSVRSTRLVLVVLIGVLAYMYPMFSKWFSDRGIIGSARLFMLEVAGLALGLLGLIG